MTLVQLGREGKIWIGGRFVPRDEANLHVLTQSLHYALATFEGGVVIHAMMVCVFTWT